MPRVAGKVFAALVVSLTVILSGVLVSRPAAAVLPGGVTPGYPDAVRARIEAVRAAAEGSGEDAFSVLVEALGDEHWVVRRTAAELLQSRPDPRAVESLRRALDDRKEPVRRAAARALGAIRDPRAVRALYAELESRSPLVMTMADQILRKLPGEVSEAEFLLFALASDDPTLEALMEALEGVEAEYGLEPSLEALASPSPLVRLGAVVVLEKVGNSQAVENLLELLEGDFPLIRMRTVYTLGEIGDPRASGALIAVLSDPSPYVRRLAAEALGKIGSTESEGALTAALGDEDRTVRKEAARALVSVRAHQGVEGLSELLLWSNQEVRALAALKLQEVPGPEATDTLLGLVDDGDVQVRKNAVRALGAQAGERAGRALITALGDGDYQVRAAAVESLGDAADPLVVDLLAAALEADPLVRSGAQRALQRNRHHRVAARVLNIFDTSESEEARIAAVQVLGAKETDGAKKKVLEALEDSSPRVQMAAEEALARQHHPHAAAILVARLSAWEAEAQERARSQQVRKSRSAEMRFCLGDGNQERRAHLARVLARFDDPEAERELSRVLQEDPCPSVRAAVLQALPGSGREGGSNQVVSLLGDREPAVRQEALRRLLEREGERAEELLTEALRSGDASRRWVIVHELSASKDSRTVGPLMAALGDESPKVRSAAAWALGRRAEPAALEALVPLLQDEEWKVRRSAASALLKIGGPRTEEPQVARLIEAARYADHPGAEEVRRLVSALGSGNPSERREAARSLGMIGDRSAVGPLVEAAVDEDVRVRHEAVRVLGMLRDPRAREALIVALADTDTGVHFEATNSLAVLEDPGLVETMVQCLRSQHPGVRSGAARVLGRLGDPRVVPPLVESLRDEDLRVRAQAAGALGMLGDRRAAGPLVELLDDAEPAVWRGAQRALRRLLGTDLGRDPEKWRARLQEAGTGALE